MQVGDFRETIRKNNRRTTFVVGMFIALYILLGLLIDVALYLQTEVSISNILVSIANGSLAPKATIITVIVACISIAVTFKMSDKLMLMGTNSKEITSLNAALDDEEKQLYNIVEELKISAGMNYMPKVYIIEDNYTNAFASGYSEKSALIAVTRRLVRLLNRDELQAVVAHELTHIRNNDIKLTLFATVLANIMLLIVDVLFRGAFYGRNRKGGGIIIILAIFLRLVFPLVTYSLLMYLSRTREYMADAGAVELMRANQPMINALKKINGDYEDNESEITLPKTDEIRRAAYIFNIDSKKKYRSKMSNMFSTHPKTQDRINELQGNS